MKQSNGNGSWSTLPSGKVRWERMYTAKNGKKKRLKVSAVTRTECRRLMKLAEDDFELSSRVTEEIEGTLSYNMEYWLTHQKKDDPKTGDTTYTRYLCTFETHIKYSTLGAMQEKQITDKDIERFMGELKKHSSEGKILEEELSYSSKDKVYKLLKMYFSYKYIRANELNPMLTVSAPVKTAKKTLKEGMVYVQDDALNEMVEAVPIETVWTDAEMAMITEYCLRPYQAGVQGSVKRGALIAFLMWSFCRVNELRCLTWRDLHLDEETPYMNITKSWKKSGSKGDFKWYIGKPKNRKARTVELLPEAVRAIKKYKELFPPLSEDDFVCVGDNGRVLSAKNFNDYLANILRGLGYDKIGNKNCTVHGLRHAGISYLIRQKADIGVVSKLAGHSSTSITEKVYVEIIKEYRQSEIIRISSNLVRCKTS